ncbi:MAG: acetoin utilization protein AcuC [Nocardioidaceae bacterium]|nr:acetoin utilization protein AcuC [Nocardioidaceae bacterium]
MPAAACVVLDERDAAYDFGAAHPLAPIRLELTMRLARDLGVIDGDEMVEVGAEAADDDTLATVHTPEYVDAVRAVRGPADTNLMLGLGTADNPTFAHMHRASALVAGASIEAARRVWTGQALHAVNVSGGLHHAMPGLASGFCIYNDVALAISWLLANGAQRVAYIDVDAHHGDGVQEIFYHDPRVLTVSIHEGPQTLFPGTGLPTEVGGEGAEGSSVNIALPPGTADAGWLRAFHAVVPQVVAAFKPDIIVSQQGCDSHMDDPLTHLMLSVDGQRASYLAICDLADQVCGGRWVATGGGGYSVLDVVPRAWTHLLSIVAGRPLDPHTPTPEQWRARVQELRGRPAPLSMTDGRVTANKPWADGYDPASWLDRSILAARTAVFPLHGLDPMP